MFSATPIKKSLSAFVFLSLVIAFSGCAKKRVELLTDQAEKFNREMRWSNVAGASSLVAEENRKTVIEKLTERLRRNQIVEYSVIDLGLDKEKKKASVIVEYSYFNVVHQDVRYRQDLQTWQWDSKKDNWYVVDVQDLKQTQGPVGR